MFNIEDFEQFVHNNTNYEEKMHELVKEAKNANFFLIMFLTKYNTVLDELLKNFDECDDDILAQMFIYNSAKQNLEPMIAAMKTFGKDLKL